MLPERLDVIRKLFALKATRRVLPKPSAEETELLAYVDTLLAERARRGVEAQHAEAERRARVEAAARALEAQAVACAAHRAALRVTLDAALAVINTAGMSSVPRGLLDALKATSAALAALG